MATLLRQTRQIAGLELDEVSRALRIRRVYLEAIEAGRYADLPGAPYVVGFVRAYADHLRLDGDKVVLRLREEIPLSDTPKRPDAPRSPNEGGAPKAAVLALGAVLAISAYGGWYFLSSRDEDVVQLVMPVPKRLEITADRTDREGAIGQPPAAEEDAAPSSAPLPGRPTTTAVPAVVADDEPAPPDGGPSATPAMDPPRDASSEAESAAVTGYGPPVPVVLRATADCWIEVRDDVRNRLVFARLLTPGETYSIAHRPGLTLLAGNAGGLDVIVNGVNRGSLGRQGEVRRDVDLDPERLTETAAAPTAR